VTPFTHDKRRIRTPQERAKLLAERGGRCAKCTRKLGPADRWDLDHAIALEAGGSDDDDNLAPICEWCHDTDKTPADHASGAKIRSIATRHTVPKEFRRHKAWGR
jgi:5-methylcytosine-specific restriction enzyme A